MSRIGKKPIPMPAKVEAQIAAEQVKVKGPKGELKVELPEGISVEKKDSTLHVVRRDNTLAAKHGLIRSLLANAVTGVSAGFQKELEIVGIGYRRPSLGQALAYYRRDDITRPNQVRGGSSVDRAGVALDRIRPDVEGLEALQPRILVRREHRINRPRPRQNLLLLKHRRIFPRPHAYPRRLPVPLQSHVLRHLRHAPLAGNGKIATVFVQIAVEHGKQR